MAFHQGPDRGFSWVVVLCCAYIHFALFGLFRSSGVMYVAMLQNYDVTREAASWPFSLCAAVFQLVGPVASVLTHYVSQRKVCLLGSAIATFGVGSCYFADSVTWINVFFGLVHGLGFGFVVTVVPVTLNQYFVKHRATAMGIAFSGGTVSSLIFPSVMEWLLENYTLKDSFLLLSGVVMNTLVASSLMREPSWLKKPLKDGTALLVKDIESNKLSNISKTFPGAGLVAKEVDEDKTSNISRASPGGGLVAKDIDGNKPLNISMRNPSAALVSKDIGGMSNIANASPGAGFLAKDIDGNRSVGSPRAITNGGNSKMEQYSGLETERLPSDKSRQDVPCVEGNPDSVLLDSSNGTISDISHRDALHKTEFEVREPLLNDKKIVIVPKKTAELAEPKQERSICHSIHQVLREPMFHLITFTMCVYFLTVHSFFMVIVDFAKDKGIQEGKAIYIISMFSLTDMFGRAGLGWVTDRDFIGRKTMVALNLGVLGVVNQLYPLIDSLEGILAVSAIHGLAVGSSITLFFVLQAECLGMDRLALVVGLISFINGIASLFRPGIIGLFRDVIGTYDWMFHFLGFLSMVFSVMWLVEALRSKDTLKRRQGGKV